MSFVSEERGRPTSNYLVPEGGAGAGASASYTGVESDTANSWLPKQWDDEADIVVVGYGGAGACAAITAHDAGSNVLILEKAPVNGGNTRVAVGGMAIPNDVVNAIEYYRALTWGTVDEESIRALAEGIVGLPNRLKKWGAELEYFPEEASYATLPGSAGFQKIGRLARTPRQIEGGMWWTYGNELFDFFEGQVNKRNIKVMYQTPATELIQDASTKEILGVRAESQGQEIKVRARKGVILSCGGFENNKEMLVNYLQNLTELPICPLGTPYNTGDGILMAAWVGAKLWHMAGVELGNFAPKAPSDKFGVGFRLLRQMPAGSPAIFVNKYSQRFMNEIILLSHRKDPFKVQYFYYERAEYPNIPFYMVFDETFRKQGPIVETRYGWWCIHKLYQWSDDNRAEIDSGWIVKANSIRELAEKLNLDSSALDETISKYNEYCKTGDDPEFGRAREWLVPIDSPPYYGTELCEPIINTQGGPKHNARAQVLDRNDKPIPRLYAAGELGSFFFPLYQGASNIPEALAFGCIAGEQAAALTPW